MSITVTFFGLQGFRRPFMSLNYHILEPMSWVPRRQLIARFHLIQSPISFPGASGKMRDPENEIDQNRLIIPKIDYIAILSLFSGACAREYEES